MFVLNAEKRRVGLKSKQLRRKGIVPGILYGKDLRESLCVQFSQKEALLFLKHHSKGSKVELMVGEGKIPTLLRDATYTSATHELEHLSFQTLLAGEVITTIAQIVLLNKEKVFANIQQRLSEISYRALPSDLIEKIEIDLEEIRVGDSIRISDLDIAKNPNIQILIPLDSMVLSIGDSNKSLEAPEPE